jgi:hypothetical protein
MPLSACCGHRLIRRHHNGAHEPSRHQQDGDCHAGVATWLLASDGTRAQGQPACEQDSPDGVKRQDKIGKGAL